MYKMLFKRLIDIIISLVALIILFPLLVVIGLIIRFNLGAPIFFVQERIGRYEIPFNMYKFRSMRDSRDKYGSVLPDADRLVPFGKFLRSTSLDELPALFNVLRGEMSLIGPRPLPTMYLPYFTENESVRHSIRGGISGLAQVNGRNALTWEQRFGFDVEYASNITLAGDLKILLKTIAKVVQRSDIGLRGVTGPVDFNIYRSSKKDEERT